MPIGEVAASPDLAEPYRQGSGPPGGRRAPGGRPQVAGPAADRPAQPNSMALYSASLWSGWRASMRRTVPDLDRMTRDWLVAPNSS